MVLPAACWNADGAYSPPLYMTALRATQLTAGGSTTVYRVFDPAGLECLGRENGKGQSWFSWLSKGCALTYLGSFAAIPYVKIIANAEGAAALAAPSASTALRAAPSSRVAPAAPVSGVALGKAFDAETIDTKWATAKEARLRVAYDTVHPEGTTLLEAACRSTMCRVEVLHNDAAAQERFVAALAPAGLFSNDGSSGAMVQRAEGRALRSTYFIGREGADLAVHVDR
jgi:hypothetical protein